MAEQANKVSKVLSVSAIEAEGNWKYRVFKFEDGTEAKNWATDIKYLEDLEKLVGHEVSYIATPSKSGLKVKLYFDKDLLSSWPFDPAKPVQSSNDYWAKKFSYETESRDPAIEFQHYQLLVAPFYLEEMKITGKSAEEVIHLLMLQAQELFKVHGKVQDGESA